jgi:hypothetical protein
MQADFYIAGQKYFIQQNKLQGSSLLCSKGVLGLEIFRGHQGDNRTIIVAK